MQSPAPHQQVLHAVLHGLYVLDAQILVLHSLFQLLAGSLSVEGFVRGLDDSPGEVNARCVPLRPEVRRRCTQLLAHPTRIAPPGHHSPRHNPAHRHGLHCVHRVLHGLDGEAGLLYVVLLVVQLVTLALVQLLLLQHGQRPPLGRLLGGPGPCALDVLPVLHQLRIQLPDLLIDAVGAGVGGNEAVLRKLHACRAQGHPGPATARST